MTQITVIKRSNYAQRRYERRAAFLAKKRQEAEQKCQVRSTEQILDSIFNKQDDTVNTLASLTLNLKDKKPQPSFDNCCLPNTYLYSARKYSKTRKSNSIQTKRFDSLCSNLILHLIP